VGECDLGFLISDFGLGRGLLTQSSLRTESPDTGRGADAGRVDVWRLR